MFPVLPFRIPSVGSIQSSIGGGSTAASGYIASAFDYDGTNDYQKRGGPLTGAIDGANCIVSSWVRLDGGNATDMRILSGVGGIIGAEGGNSPGASAAQGVLLVRRSSNTFRLSLTFGDATLRLSMDTVSTYVSGAAWIHILASYDGTNSHFYINDVSDKLVNSAAAGNIGFATAADWIIGALPTAFNPLVVGERLNACVSELFMHSSYLDLSVTANRRKFISATGKPVSLGADGSIPLGVQPLLYVPSGDASGIGNKGTGGAFTTVGALIVCSTSPSS